MLHRQVLWADRKPTPLLRSQWVRLGAAQALQPGAVYLEEDQSATRALRSLWQAAFPDRDPLPFGPLAKSDGRATDAFLDVLA